MVITKCISNKINQFVLLLSPYCPPCIPMNASFPLFYFVIKKVGFCCSHDWFLFLISCCSSLLDFSFLFFPSPEEADYCSGFHVGERFSCCFPAYPLLCWCDCFTVVITVKATKSGLDKVLPHSFSSSPFIHQFWPPLMSRVFHRKQKISLTGCYGWLIYQIYYVVVFSLRVKLWSHKLHSEICTFV